MRLCVVCVRVCVCRGSISQRLHVVTPGQLSFFDGWLKLTGCFFERVV